MMMTNEVLKKNLLILEIEVGSDEEIHAITLKDASIAFQKLALILHPDKAGTESTAAFQELRNAYELVRDHFKKKETVSDDSVIVVDDAQRFFDDNFEKFNFPYENKGSFTVSIEDYLADTWQDCITELYLI